MGTYLDEIESSIDKFRNQVIILFESQDTCGRNSRSLLLTLDFAAWTIGPYGSGEWFILDNDISSNLKWQINRWVLSLLYLVHLGGLCWRWR